MADLDHVARLLAAALEEVGAGARPGPERLCRACSLLLPVDGAAICLVGDTGRREMLCGGDALSTRLEDLQFMLGEGPCVDAFSSGTPVVAADLAACGDRWPAFAPEAVELGAGAVYALPLTIGAIRIGVLDLYRRTPAEPTGEQSGRLLDLAGVIGAPLLAELSFTDDPESGPHPLDQAVGCPEIHQATGMILVQLGVTAEEALTRLRAHAFAHGRSTREVARDVVARRLRFTE
ncbi:hypothetical protein HDA32_001834 [Spinactinospora alkalitolerans]|uniref:ANTAR domain-containing protein n=1 Tax=Spinactinospora alkalitolerans TaxID=687207 RepID=A0A852TXE5_9ACTN|nr:GAF and ANTAR domain-containing protein [Spinactinospora alkalitolerans]NYE46714.1 hypothetical protein [Spinactinospora alkalitolerans]